MKKYIKWLAILMFLILIFIFSLLFIENMYCESNIFSFKGPRHANKIMDSLIEEDFDRISRLVTFDRYLLADDNFYNMNIKQQRETYSNNLSDFFNRKDIKIKSYSKNTIRRDDCFMFGSISAIININDEDYEVTFYFGSENVNPAGIYIDDDVIKDDEVRQIIEELEKYLSTYNPG